MDNRLMEVGRGRFNELLYANKFSKKSHPIRTEGKEWYAFDDKAWNPTKRHCFLPLALEVLPAKHRKSRNARSILDFLEDQSQLKPGERLKGCLAIEGDSVRVNVANGTLRVMKEEVKLEPQKKEDNFTGVLAAAWNPEAKREKFDAFLNEVMPDMEDQALFQWFCGYMLFPDAKQYEVFLLCYGNPGTGKNTLASAIESVIGTDHDVLITRLSMTQLCTSGPASYSLPKLQRAIVNIGSELDTVELDESGNFKQIVSGEGLEVRSIYGSPYTMTTTCKLWFLANYLPRFKNGTEAELRRSRFIHFQKSPAKRDTTLKDGLALERDGILAWMVLALQAILSGFPCPEGGLSSRRVKETFAINNDAVSYFVKHHCILDNQTKMRKDTLVSAFEEFVETHGLPEKFVPSFLRRLYEKFPNVMPIRERNQDGASYLVHGIKLKH